MEIRYKLGDWIIFNDSLFRITEINSDGEIEQIQRIVFPDIKIGCYQFGDKLRLIGWTGYQKFQLI